MNYIYAHFFLSLDSSYRQGNALDDPSDTLCVPNK